MKIKSQYGFPDLPAFTDITSMKELLILKKDFLRHYHGKAGVENIDKNFILTP